MSRIHIMLISLGWMGLAWTQDVYQGTDEQGNPSFSDVPQANSKKLDLKPMNVLPALKSPDLRLKVRNKLKPTIKYSEITVTAPANDTTVFINADNLPISVNVVPAIWARLGHRLQIMFGNKVLVENQTSFTLDDADRGSYDIIARIIDEQGKTIIASSPVTVHIKKPSL